MEKEDGLVIDRGGDSCFQSEKAVAYVSHLYTTVGILKITLAKVSSTLVLQYLPVYNSILGRQQLGKRSQHAQG